MRALKFLGFAIVFVLVLACGAIAYLVNLDPARHKLLVVEAVKVATGRELVINGDVRLDLSLTPALLIEDVSLANAPWGSRPSMAGIKLLEVRVRLPSLLTGKLDLPLFLVRDASFFLETDKDGRGNWAFGDTAKVPTKLEARVDEYFVGLEFGAVDVRVENATITYRDGASGKVQNFGIATFTATTASKDEPLAVSLAAAFQGQPVRMRGTMRAVTESPDDRRVNVDFAATGFGFEATAKGRLPRASGTSVDAVDVEVRAKSSETLARMLGLDIPRLTEFHAAGKVSGHGKAYRLRSLAASAKVPGGAFAMSGSIANLFDGAGLDLEVAATIDDPEPLARFVAIELLPMGPVTGSASLIDRDGRYRLDDLHAKVALSDGEATINGSIADLEKFEGVELSIAANISDPRPILDAMGYEIPTLRNLSARGRLRSAQTHMRLEKLDAEVEISGAAATVTGAIADLRTFQGIDLDVGLTATSLRNFSDVAGTELPDAQPVRVAAHVGERDGAYLLSGLRVRIGRTTLSGHGLLDLAGRRKHVTARLDADVLDLEQLTSGSAAAGAGRHGGGIISSGPLPLELLRMFDGNVTVTAKQAIVRTLNDERVIIDRLLLPLTLSGGTFSMGPTGELAGGTLNGALHLGAAANIANADGNLEIRNFSLSTVLNGIVGSRIATGMPATVQLEIGSRGESSSGLLEHATGGFMLDAGAGRLNNAMIDRASTDLVFGLLAFLVPKSERDKGMQLECAVVRLDIKDGVARANNSIAMMSDRTRLVAGGTIDLRQQQLDMVAQVSARHGITLSVGELAGAIRITGPLSDPQFGIADSGLARTAVTAGAAIMTGGLTLLAETAVGLVSGSQDVCALARGTAPERFKVEETLQNPLKAIGGAIKDLFGN